MDRRALVLGGGGVTGIAWEIGMIAGLADQGIDLAAADVIIGTSAGSVVGADITSGQEPEALYQAHLAPPDPEPAARIGWGLIGRLAWVMNTSLDPVRARARIGHWALAARTMPEADRRKVLEARLPAGGWPAKMLKVTAVSGQSGRPMAGRPPPSRQATRREGPSEPPSGTLLSLCLRAPGEAGPREQMTRSAPPGRQDSLLSQGSWVPATCRSRPWGPPRDMPGSHVRHAPFRGGGQVRLDEGEVGEAGEGAPAPSGAALLDFDGADCPLGFVVGEDVQVWAGGEPQDHVFEGAEPAGDAAGVAGGGGAPVQVGGGPAARPISRHWYLPL